MRRIFKAFRHLLCFVCRNPSKQALCSLDLGMVSSPMTSYTLPELACVAPYHFL